MKKLNEGSIGSVYQIEMKNGQHVALKQIKSSNWEVHQGRIKEANIMKDLIHKNILKFIEVHEEQIKQDLYVIFIVMELAQDTLFGYFQRRSTQNNPLTEFELYQLLE